MMLADRISFADHIEVLVGPEKKLFAVHRDVICDRSPFFRAACSERWQQGSKAIELLDDDPEIFDTYLLCVYKDKINTGGSEENKCDADITDFDGNYDRLLRTYILADKLGDVVTTNMVIEEMIEYSAKAKLFPAAFDLQLGFAETCETSPVQLLFVDHFVHEAGVRSIEWLCSEEEVPEQLLRRVLIRRAQLEMENLSKKLCDVYQFSFTAAQKCRYHQHSSEHPRCGDGCEESK